jgi:beta-lactamase class A
MTPQAPITQQPTLTSTQEVQIADQLHSDDTQQVIKEAILKQLLQAAITQNEAETVLTGVTVTDLQDGHTIFGHNADTEHFAASINKIPVALLVLEELRAGRLSLDQTTTWLASDVRGGFGLYDQPGAPLQATVRDVIYDMLNRSGNTVVRVLVNNHLGGAAAVNARWATEPQLSHTFLIPLDGNRFFLGNSTPHDSMWAMEQLMKTQDRPARFMKDALATNIFTDFGVRSQLEGTDFILLVNKIGLLDDIEGNNRHDVGIIYNRRTRKSYGYSFFTTSPFESTTATPRAEQSLKDMGSYVLRFAGDKKRASRTPDTSRLRQRGIERRLLY